MNKHIRKPAWEPKTHRLKTRLVTGIKCFAVSPFWNPKQMAKIVFSCAKPAFPCSGMVSRTSVYRISWIYKILAPSMTDLPALFTDSIQWNVSMTKVSDYLTSGIQGSIGVNSFAWWRTVVLNLMREIVTRKIARTCHLGFKRNEGFKHSFESFAYISKKSIPHVTIRSRKGPLMEREREREKLMYMFSGIYEGCSKFFHVETGIFANKRFSFAKL